MISPSRKAVAQLDKLILAKFVTNRRKYPNVAKNNSGTIAGLINGVRANGISKACAITRTVSQR